ncbi:TonB-dependent receptor [uncultured Dokdonia sp.]|uniref:TonB-dependent receptor n=1 Tax=uncultured Dokdonia sp. TaxID=575653 RepID=UPI00260775B1|nr:TonB-dependent receptor [uncultured Dokdonia sp.]
MFKNILYVVLFLVMSTTYATETETKLIDPITTALHEINGVVKDSQTDLPLEGIVVYNKTSGTYASSNISGYYKLNDISVGDVITFSGLGYASQEITITETQLDTILDIRMEEAAVSLDQIVLVSEVNSLTSLVDIDVQNNPVKSAQEILRRVPGLIIGQHAGGGKAEQLFLRGFDIDHGTDVAIDVDGLPVNMVSHAHGQGYADLHFVIPETIDNIDFGKGPYYADKGNFNTAGYVSLKTKKAIDENLISLEVGQFNTVRAVSLIKLLDGEYSNAYFGSELVLTDGVFDSPQDFNRINVMGRYNFNNFDDEELTLSVSHFQSKWNASGQIPQRAVDQGLISRFGAIDDTEGGLTSRSNIWLNHRKQLSEHQELKTKAFLSRYNFELYSNFTFFLEDPENGDQIRQQEGRTLFGAETVYEHTFDQKNERNRLRFNAGLGFRYDDNNDVELSRTRDRRVLLERLAFGDIDEVNAYGFASATYKVGNWTFNPGLRIDYFEFDYVDFLNPFGFLNPDLDIDNISEDDVIFSPKFNTVFTPNSQLQLFAKAGFGFHSNDSRVVTAGTGEETLPSAFGVDLGTIVKPVNGLVLNATLWGLSLEQEFVYVGDAAVVEPSGRSRRLGVEFGARYQINKWLYANADVNYTYARSIDEVDGQDFIPLAPDLTSSGSITVQNLGKFSGNLSYRYIKDRPANEDNSIVAEGYFVTDLNANYAFAKGWNIGLIVENLFDTEWNETQFATETRLFNEANPVEEITFTPGTPFSARVKLSVTF